MKKKKYHIITFGCQMNKLDSQKLAAKLEKKGYHPAKKAKTADLIVFNICSVRQSAVNKAYSRICQLRSENKSSKIILTGCVLKPDSKRFSKQVDEIWPISQLEQKAKHQAGHLNYIAVMTGCNNFCSYCVVPYTRGREKSRSARAILREANALIKKGTEEIMLLGQNVNSYKSPDLLSTQKRPFDFPDLLVSLCQIPGKFKISFITSHPKDMSDKLIRTIAGQDKIKKDVHLPVQSGDNTILKKMNRGYTVHYYKKLVGKIRKAMPQARISTDVIVGFPGETEKRFQNTVKLIKEVGFTQVFVAAYSPRTQTAASKLEDDVTSQEKKRRLKTILNLVRTSTHT